MTPNIPISAWLPDADPTVPGVLSDVHNMIPTPRGYVPQGELAPTAFSIGTLPTQCYGADYVRFSTNTALLFAGTATGIYAAWGGVLLDLSRTTAYTAISGASTAWRFASFINAAGGDVALAISSNNPLQLTAAPHSGTKFTNISGAPAGAATMAVNQNFVMVGGFFGGAWPYSDGWWCSAIEDCEDWTPDVATLCTRGRLLQTPGAIVRMYAYGPYIFAFKNASVVRGTFVGAPDAWSWTPISTSVGIAGHDAIAEADGVLYWLGKNGFYQSNGGGVQTVPNAPWQWLMNDMDDRQNVSFVQARYDPMSRVIRWHYPSGVGSTLDKFLAFHPGTGRWGRGTMSIEWTAASVFEYMTDPINGAYQAVPDAPVMIDTTHSMRTFSDGFEDSTWTTGDIGDDDAVTANLRARVRYLTAPDTSFVQHYHRMTLSDALTSGATAARSDGKFDFSHAARWHRLQFSQTGRYEIIGFSADIKPSGTR